ncbi:MULTISPECIES: DUF2283 domain-containing protein [Corynebacterium]|uniref:Uncharacterized conserved small protein n=3 Tax=Corynebacterium TaxID=1716 RepID=A0ABY6TF64_9CORY|nr:MULTISPECIES: DUF2283 domain-containing protein [Corynebacterium]ERS41196.1 hypothetical protein HMPREF1293_01334 [Corynebacterium sp. KPL1996]ERS44026.1 hypothetical protein HMPREF1287_00506 [Corynebacterium sp. KPL1986]ERS58895.1 hypothetical protein HMPREF1261_01910 [Corynebacterium sp. KPL1818]ERS71543.1 hypothetical protein HMPREF1300_01588 [Corynebacterium sp. KPL2004]ERS71951.1 hypothetical protein HMPREF1295_00865 [Corynebacterium sp. KPL1998]
MNTRPRPAVLLVQSLMKAGELSDLLGTLDAPWAIDTTGASVHTWYEIRQSTIVQHISPNSSTQFPVVVDPFWIPFLGIIGGNLPRHALTQMARRKINKELVEHVIKQAEQARVIMNFDYDPEADAAYLAIAQPGTLSERQISAITIEEMEGEIEIDIDENGKVIGIEFVNASLILPSAFLNKANRIS